MKQGKNQDTGALNGRSRYHNESPTLQESFHVQRRVAKNRPKYLILHKFTDGLSENDTCLHCTVHCLSAYAQIQSLEHKWLA